jgi:hypothetical protein
MSTFIGKKTKTYDKSEKPLKKKKFDTPYPESTIVAEAYVNTNVKAKLLKNDWGKFVDFRKYYQDKPTTKGIRMPIKPFLNCINRLSKSMKDLVDDEK